MTRPSREEMELSAIIGNNTPRINALIRGMMMGIRTSIRWFPVGAALVLAATLLTACTGGDASADPSGPTATGTPTESPNETALPTPSPAPTPTEAAPDPLTTVASMVLQPEALELRASDGTEVRSFDYMGSAADAVAALTTVFGEPPVVEEHEGTTHFPPYTTHVWDTFELQERHYDEAVRESKGITDIAWPRFAVYFDSPSTHGIELTTAKGVQAGDRWADYSAQTDVGLIGCTGVSVEVVRFTAEHESHVADYTAGVGARLDETGETVDWLGSPQVFEPVGCT